jgi:hypothetical protein
MSSQGAFASGPVGRNGRNENDYTVTGKQVSDECQSAHILIAIFHRESQIAAEDATDLVAIQNFSAETLSR